MSEPNDPPNPPAANKKKEEDDYGKQRVKNLQAELALLQKKKDIDAGTLKRQIEILEVQERLNAALLASGKMTEEEAIAKDKSLEDSRKKLSLEKNLSDELTGQFKSLTGITGESNNLLGRMILIGKEGGSISDALADSFKQMSNLLTPTNLLVGALNVVVSQTKQLFTQMDQTFAQFEKTAGGVDAFKGRIEDLRRSNVEYALSIQEAGAAFSDLKANFAGFAGVSVQTQDALARTTAQMTKLGVSSGDTIKIQNMLVKGFQMTGEQAGDMQKQLMATAKSMGLPMQKVVSDFANASKNMKAHGANMQKVFIDLQNQSKNLGIEFSKLQAITGQFDTFDAAADAAGNLNAILGGDYLNSIQLLNADEGERVRLMQDALKASGKTFEEMSKQERMAAANALGLENATELQQLMNNETQVGTVEALNKAEAEKELAQSVKDVTTLQEKLTAIMAQFSVVLTPVLDLLKDILTPIGKLLSENPALAKTIAGVTLAVGGLVAAFYTLRAGYQAFEGFKSFRDGMAAAGGGITGFLKQLWAKITGTKVATKVNEELAESEDELSKSGDGGENLASTVEKVGQAAKNSWREILAFGAAVLMIGGGIAIAALGLAQLVQAFQGLTGPQILGALGALLIVLGAFIVIIALLGVIMLAGPGAAAVAGMLALGAAFLMIGIGIGIAALGLAQLVKAFGGLGDAALPAAIAVAAFSVSMYLVTAALAAAIPVTVTAGVAFAAAAPGILAFGAAVAFVGLGVAVAAVGIGFLAKSVGDMFEKISKTNPQTISAAFSAIFDSLSLTNIAKFAEFADQTEELTESLNKLVFSLTAVSAGMKAMSAINTLFSPGAVSSPNVSATPGTATTAAAATNNAGSSNIVPVAIYIDSKKVGEVLDPRYKKMIESSLNNIGGRTVPI